MSLIPRSTTSIRSSTGNNPAQGHFENPRRLPSPGILLCSGKQREAAAGAETETETETETGRLFIGSDPSPLMPDILQRPLFVSSQPPFAEPHLQQEHQNPDQQAGRVSAPRGKIKAEREIDEGPDNGLGYIIGKAHPAVEAQAGNGGTELPALVKQDERSDQDQRKSQLLPHVERRSGCLPDDCTVVRDKLLERIQRGEGNGGDDQRFHPEAEILFGGGEQLFPADIETQQEQPGGLDETPGVYRPQQAGLLPQGDIAQDEIPKIPGFRVFGHSGIHFTDPQVGQPVGRIQQGGYAVVPFDRLQQENDGGGEDSPVAPVARKKQDESRNDEQQQNIPGREKSRVQGRETGQQHQPPQETIAEVPAPPLQVVALNVERESEQEGENRVGLSGKQGKDDVEDPLIQCIQPARGIGRIDREDKMFQVVNQENSHNGKTP